MATSELRATRTAAFGVVLVAITAAVISFSHVRAVAMRAGESDLTAWLLPVSIDGAVVAAVSVLLADSRAGRRPAPLTWMLLALGLTASLAANIASAEPTGIARAVAAWPPLALALGIEVLAGLVRRADPPSEARSMSALRIGSSAADSVPDHGQTSAPRQHADGMSGMLVRNGAASGIRDSFDRHHVLDDHAAVALIRELDATVPEGKVSRLQIQNALGCGGSRAARLATLARGPGSNQAR